MIMCEVRNMARVLEQVEADRVWAEVEKYLEATRKPPLKENLNFIYGMMMTDDYVYADTDSIKVTPATWSTSEDDEMSEGD